MSVQLGNLAITSGVDATFQGAPSEGVKAILIGNESGLTVTITMESGGVQKTLYPSTLDWFNVNPGFSGNILIHPISILNNVSSWPASSLLFDAIGLNDPEEASMYPLALQRNTNVGNVVNLLGGIATSVQNDISVAGTTFVESTVSGDTQPGVTLTNDGVMVLGNGAGRVGKMFLSDNSSLLQVTGGANFDNGLVNIPGGSTGQLQLLSLALTAGTLTRIAFGFHSATTTGTAVSHGLGATPSAVFICPRAITTNFNVDFVGLTTFTVTVGSNCNVWWLAIA